MTEEVRQNEALEALQAFNTAVTTTRLYPAEAPQVPASVEKAYQAIKNHLRKNGDLVISFENGEGMLCGNPIQRQTLGKLHGADIFQHLKLLDLPYAVIRPGIDRRTFKSILNFFTTPLQKIKKEGGGQDYASLVGLSNVFPEQYEMVSKGQPAEDPEKVLQAFYALFSDVPEDWIAQISNEQQSTAVNQEFVDICRDPGKASRIVALCIARAVQQVWESDIVELSAAFDRIIKNTDGMVNPSVRDETASQSADLLLQGLKGQFLAILAAQNFAGSFGETLFRALMVRIGNDDFRSLIEFIQGLEKSYEKTFGDGSTQHRFVKNTHVRLLDTPRAKQFQALEKTRAILEEGEKERRRKRIQAGLNAILKGEISVLEHEEIVQHLPQTVERLLTNSKDDVAALLIENLAKALVKGNKTVEENVSRSLGRIGSILVEAKKWNWLEKLSGPYLHWIKEVDKADAVYEEILKVLKQVMMYGWKTGNNKLADQILTVFFKIRTGLIGKSPEVMQLTGRVQDKHMDRRFLTTLLSACLADPADEVLGERLSMHGPVAAGFLISTLIASENAGERILILELLANMGPLLPPVILKKISEPMPWFGKRNLLKLLAETGGEKHADTVLAYLGHEDLRVQREAFVCLYKISGGRRKNILIRALSLAGEGMKEQVVKALTAVVDDEVVGHLIELLKDQEQFSSDIRGPLIQQICRAMAHSVSKDAIAALESFLSQPRKGSVRKLEPQVWRAAENAIEQIKNNLKEKNSENRVELPQEDEIQEFPLQELEGTQLITKFPEEQQVKAYLEQGNTGRAKVLLSDLISKTAKMHQFTQADKLREWLIEIDPMALTDIIQAAEIIENEKTASIDKDHLEVWNALYDVLTTEEFNALYYSFENKKYSTEEIIVKQGTIRPALFFINSGRVKLYHRQDDMENLVKIVSRGEVIGAHSFFSSSVWTLNVSAMGDVELSILDLEKTEEWAKDFPALESKLNDFCMRFGGVKDFFAQTGKDRRVDKRLPLSGRINTIILDENGKDSGITSKGDLTDISSGGLSFFIHISQKRNARLLLGRNVRVVLPTESLESGKLFRALGVIVAVFSHRVMQNEYSAHVRFDHPMNEKDMRGIIEALKQDQ